MFISSIADTSAVIVAATSRIHMKHLFLLIVLLLSARLYGGQGRNATAVAQGCNSGAGGCETISAGKDRADKTGKPSSPSGHRAGPRYDVTQFGAVGDGSKDDTAAIQAAFNACYNGGKPPRGGVVEFPGPHTYIVTGTIYVYDGCQPEGVTANDGFVLGPSQGPVTIGMKSPAVGTPVSFAGFITATNASYFPLYSPKNRPSSIVTVNATNSYSIGTWGIYEGCSTLTGQELNNIVGQVVAASGSSFTSTAASAFPTLGAVSDNCTFTPISVLMATDAIARNEQPFTNLQLQDLYGYTAPVGIDLFMGSRLDSGSHLDNMWFGGANAYALVYFSDGALDFDMGRGTRFNAPAKLGQIYWKNDGGGELKGDTVSFSTNSRLGGASILVDSLDCVAGTLKLGLSNSTLESDTSYQAGFAGIMLLACPTTNNFPQLILSLDKSGTACGTNAAGTNCTLLSVFPSNETAVYIAGTNATMDIASGAQSTPPIVGLPGAIRGNGNGTAGYASHTTYSVPYRSLNSQALGSVSANAATFQCLTDCYFNQIYQYGTFASPFLEADTTFAALPNGTTLFAGQVLAPPANWASGSATNQRFPVDVVYQSGTTGSPNYGVTTCTSPGGGLVCSGPSATIKATSCASNVLTVTTSANTFGKNQQMYLIGTRESFLNGYNGTGGLFINSSATSSTVTFPFVCPSGFNGNSSDTGTVVVSSTVDLGYKQHISIPGEFANNQINSINALNPAAVLITLNSRVKAFSSPAALKYSPPVVGLEMQFPTKASAAPTSGTWAQGDTEQNSGAMPNGIAAWVNVASGKPGKWAGIPLGNSSGQINSSQISGTTGSGNVVLAVSPTVSGLTDSGTTNLNNVAIRGTCSGCGGTNLRTVQAYCTGTAPDSSIVAMFGAGSATPSCASLVGAESVAQVLMTTKGTLSGLAVRCGHAGSSASSGAFSIWDLPSGTAMSAADSGINTGLTVTYGTASANTTLFDTTHTFSYAMGDLLRIQFTTQARETLGNCEASFNY